MESSCRLITYFSMQMRIILQYSLFEPLQNGYLIRSGLTMGPITWDSNRNEWVVVALTMDSATGDQPRLVRSPNYLDWMYYKNTGLKKIDLFGEFKTLAEMNAWGFTTETQDGWSRCRCLYDCSCHNHDRLLFFHDRSNCSLFCILLTKRNPVHL